jgi:hypothetical protein
MLSEGMDWMEISKYPELQESWHDEFCLQHNMFYSLKTLKLYNCDIKQYAIPSNILPCLKSLKELEVRNCSRIEVIFSKNDTEAIPFQLINLTLKGLPELKFIWEKNSKGLHSFQNMEQVSVKRCESILTLFPADLAENLKMLEKLKIKSCDQLRELVGMEEDASTGLIKKFVFPRLTSLDLYKLPELTWFYSELFSVECPKLNDISVLDCPKLELFEGAQGSGYIESAGSSFNRQPLLSDLTVSNIESALSVV